MALDLRSPWIRADIKHQYCFEAFHLTSTRSQELIRIRFVHHLLVDSLAPPIYYILLVFICSQVSFEIFQPYYSNPHLSMLVFEHHLGNSHLAMAYIKIAEVEHNYITVKTISKLVNPLFMIALSLVVSRDSFTSEYQVLNRLQQQCFQLVIENFQLTFLLSWTFVLVLASISEVTLVYTLVIATDCKHRLRIGIVPVDSHLGRIQAVIHNMVGLTYLLQIIE